MSCERQPTPSYKLLMHASQMWGLHCLKDIVSYIHLIYPLSCLILHNHFGKILVHMPFGVSSYLLGGAL